MKNTKKQTIGDEIAEQINWTGTTFTITMTEDCEGQPTVLLKDNVCGDATIIQSIANQIRVTHLDPAEIEALKAILL